jgi:creatinine amidohydrolase
MASFLAIADLTWPEAAALPRALPLVIPLGEGYDRDKLAEALGRVPQVGLLPAIPFGWRGSGLAVPEAVFERLLANLLESLRDDGFSRVYALTPQGLDLKLGAERLVQPLSPTQDSPPIPDDGQRGKVVIIPIGHTEQHGPHLPLCTDTAIIEAIGQGTAESVPQRATVLPAYPYGASTHRSAFAGTMNCGGRAFEDFWLAVVDTLAGRGFDRFYLISGHGGNYSYLVNVVKSAGEKHRRIFCATTWLHTSGRIATPVLQATRRSARGGMGHAGELETAMILALRPDLVHMDRVVDEVDFITTPGYFMDWVEGGELVANPPWADDTRTGAYGAGSVATAENGNLWLETAVREKVAHVEEIHEQHERREARRNSGFGLWGAAN